VGIGRSSFWFALGTVFSRFSGLLRDSVVAGVYGASTAMDAFIVAFRIPNLLRDMLAEGALSSAFTKVYSSISVTDPQRARKLLHDSVSLTVMLSVFVCAAGSVAAPWLVDLMTVMKSNDLQAAQWFKSNAEILTAVLFPYLFFPMVGAVLMGALHHHGRFFVTGMMPIGMNLGFVAGALLLHPFAEQVLPDSWGIHVDRGILGLSVGVLLGGAASLAIEIWGIWHLGLKDFRWSSIGNAWTADTRKVVKIMIPAALAAGVGPINITINTNFATSLGEGAVTWLNYAFRLLQLPIGIFGVAIASAALPALTRSITKAGNRVDGVASRELQNSIELVLWMMIPCMCGLIGGSSELIQLLFQHMAFGSSDAEATASALKAYSYGVVGYGLIKLLTSFYFAVEKTTYALKISLLSIFVNYAGNSYFVSKFGHNGLALTSSFSLSLNALMLMIGLRGFDISWQFKNLIKTVLMLFTGSAVVYAAQSFITDPLAIHLSGLNIHHKLSAALVLCADAAMISIVFAGLAMLRFELKPRQLLLLIRTRGRKK
jgi:putative peptidoglycan lipid II flippase